MISSVPEQYFDMKKYDRMNTKSFPENVPTGLKTA
jgi:hypothetical protein